MKISTFLILIVVIWCSSCIESPNFPTTPKIELINYRFVEVGDQNDPDSLQITIKFEDNEGDLGLDADETFYPYELHKYFNNKTGRAINFSEESILLEDLMKYSDRANIDTLPPFTDPYTCTRWTTFPNLFVNDTTRLQDTVYFQFNPRHHNFLVDFYVEEGGSFRKFDFRTEIDCSTNFDGRFPVIAKDNRKDAPQEGEITYTMANRFFLSFFEGKRLQLRIQIIDRAGNFSNPITTPAFTLREIQG